MNYAKGVFEVHLQSILNTSPILTTLRGAWSDLSLEHLDVGSLQEGQATSLGHCCIVPDNKHPGISESMQGDLQVSSLCLAHSWIILAILLSLLFILVVCKLF